MTKAEAIEHLKDILDDVPNDKCIDWIEALNKAIEVLRQEPCEDAISRHAVLVGLASIAKAKAKSDAQKSLMGRVMFFTERLPSVTPKPKTGHWIMTNDYHPGAYENIHYVKCSCCREDSLEEGNYCPNCGAEMYAESEG